MSANINSGSKNTEESDEEEDSESDDPDRLWCICQQPHDDRWVKWTFRIILIKYHIETFH